MQKFKLNFIVDALMFILIMGLAGIGFLLEYVLVHGQEIPVKYGINADIFLLGLDRHKWGDIHLILAFILLGLLVLHIILHWRVICVYYEKLILRSALRRVFTLLFAVLNIILLTFFLFLKPELREFERGFGRGRYLSSQGQPDDSFFVEMIAASDTTDQKIQQPEKKEILEQTRAQKPEPGKDQEQTPLTGDFASSSAGLNPSGEQELTVRTQDETQDNRGSVGSPAPSVTQTPGGSHQKEQGEHSHNKQLDMVRGMYTVGEIAETYGVPVAYITEKLGLPSGTSSLEKLGVLRRKYGFRMSDVERIILEYKRNAID